MPTPDFSLTMCSSDCSASAAWSGPGGPSLARVRRARAGHIWQCEAGARTDEGDAERGRTFQRPPFGPGNHRAPRALVSPIQARLPNSHGNDGRTGRLSLIRPSCAGSSAMFQNSKSGGTASRPSSRIMARRRDLRQIRGRWTYLCRAVDKAGKTVDFLLRAKRHVGAAKAFFRWAFKNQGRPPRKIALEDYQASPRAAHEVLEQHGARRLRSTASNACIASGKVNSPQANSEPPEKPRPRFGARPSAPLIPMNARAQSRGHS